MKSVSTPFVILLISGLLGLSGHAFAQVQPIRVACVGNSITEGAGNGDSTYPKVLQALLGSGYDVRNYGLGGRTLLKHGDYPYWREEKYGEVKDWDPQIVVIMLGTNDTKPQNWKYSAEFVPDFEAFVESFKNLPGHPRIWICKPVPVFKDNYGITQSIMTGQVIPDIKQIAKAEKIDIIDAYKALSGHGDYFRDGIHPDRRGDALLAQAVYKSIRHYRPKP